MNRQPDTVQAEHTRAQSPARTPAGSRVFGVWLICFYSAWLAIVFLAVGWQSVISHWPIGAAMAGGSFVAGSSPIAGGAVGFPVLVFVFDHPAHLGKTFALAIQSIGMMSASIYILSQRRKVEWRILRHALIGGAAAMPIGTFFVAPYIPDITVKVLFSILYGTFGLLNVLQMKSIIGTGRSARPANPDDWKIGLAIGLIGGLLSAVVGVGADILMYGMLVLYFRVDIKVAIPTGVILMAVTSLIGIYGLLLSTLISPTHDTELLQTLPYWAAAAPVVAIGAPLGSFVARHVPRAAILLLVAALCLFQFVWTCHHEHISGWSLAAVTAIVLAANLGLHLWIVQQKRSHAVSGFGG